jgi:hypothetical protein
VHLVIGNAGAGLCLNIREHTPEVCHPSPASDTQTSLCERPSYDAHRACQLLVRAVSAVARCLLLCAWEWCAFCCVHVRSAV